MKKFIVVAVVLLSGCAADNNMNVINNTIMCTLDTPREAYIVRHNLGDNMFLNRMPSADRLCQGK